MSDVKSSVVKQLNQLTSQLFRLKIEDQMSKDRYNKAAAKLSRDFEDDQQRIGREIEVVSAEIWQLIAANRSQLIADKKRSFVTAVGVFQFKAFTGTTKVADGAGVMAVARRLGVVRKIAVPQYTWKLNLKKFRDWLEKHDEYRPEFQEFLVDTDSGERLYVRPNEKHPIFTGSKRLVTESVTIESPS